jgi:hypothetical protein
VDVAEVVGGAIVTFCIGRGKSHHACKTFSFCTFDFSDDSANRGAFANHGEQNVGSFVFFDSRNEVHERVATDMDGAHGDPLAKSG